MKDQQERAELTLADMTRLMGRYGSLSIYEVMLCAEKAEAELARIRKERDEARADAIRTLASAIHKFAPELSLELTGKWNVAKGEAEAALEDFLAFLRSPAPSGEQT
jgi:F0F1-type ATP synthase membrane subunit b/b'